MLRVVVPIKYPCVLEKSALVCQSDSYVICLGNKSPNIELSRIPACNLSRLIQAFFTSVLKGAQFYALDRLGSEKKHTSQSGMLTSFLNFIVTFHKFEGENY